MLTLLIILIPLIAGLFLHFLKGKSAQAFALLSSLGTFAASLLMMFMRDDGLTSFDIAWIEKFGIHFSIATDGISVGLGLLTTFLVPLIILGLRENDLNPGLLALILLMESGLLGVFSARDGFLFYVFWELALIPAYLICLLWGGEKKFLITFRFFIFTLGGSLLMLAGLIYLYLQTPGVHSFGFQALMEAGKTAKHQDLLFWCFFLAFAIKMPVFPFHSWQPDTYTDAPYSGTMMLSGLMMKMGAYGLIRILLPMVPGGFENNGTIAIWLATVGMVYGALLAWNQKDFKRLIAYSSMSHGGLIAAGFLSANIRSLDGGMVQMISHGLVTVGLFYSCQWIEERTGTRKISDLGGLRHTAPIFAGFLLLVLLASIGLPMTSGFTGEFLLFSGLFEKYPWAAAFGGISVILGAVYMLNSYRIMMLGESKKEFSGFRDLQGRELVVAGLLVAGIIGLGIFPQLIIKVCEPTYLLLKNPLAL